MWIRRLPPSWEAVLDVSGDLPKSFVVCDHPYHPQIVYLSQLNTSTLKNRAESGKLVL